MMMLMMILIDSLSLYLRALYTYEDNESNDLSLAASGGGGLPEITLTFDSAKVMYGFCSLKEPAAALPRYILINWVGDDVPDARKCACASHVATIADFFQGVEVTINASSLEDIDPSAIGQRLTNGTAAAVASPVLSRLRTRDEEHADVGTVYEKTNAEVEMKKINREEFWEQAKREEELRKEEEKKRLAEERTHSLWNPREFFKQKERAMTVSVDTSPVSVHRTGRLDSPFLRQQHSPSPTPPPRGASPLRTPPHARTQPAAAAGRYSTSTLVKKHNEVGVLLVVSRLGGEAGAEAAGQESTPTKPVQSVAPQARDSSGFSVWESGTEHLVNLWDSSSAPPTNPSQTSQSSNLVDLMGDVLPSAAAAAGRPQPLLSFDDMMDGTLCSATVAEDDPSSLVDVTCSDQMTLSYQHALQHASGDGQELDDGQLLMTNGETLLKEGTQASEGYFSQSQEEEFGQSENSSAKPAPVFYNKPPEIDITCWDTDPVEVGSAAS
uniref:Drebrin n=1 Tax=Scophthalmus maximus TaxID=52904 RepID=A0A8D3ALG5_SCOMX